MKATILIKKLTEMVETSGEFEVHVPGDDKYDSVPVSSMQVLRDEAGKLESVTLGE